MDLSFQTIGRTAGVLIAALFAQLASANADAVGTLAEKKCPSPRFKCVSPGPPPSAPAPPPTGPGPIWMPSVLEIMPNAKTTNQQLRDLLRDEPNVRPLGAADKSRVRDAIGDQMKYIQPGKTYLLPMNEGKGIYFKGSEVRP